MTFLPLRTLRSLRLNRKRMAHRNAAFSTITTRQNREIGVRLEAIGHIVEDAGNIAVAIPERKKVGAASAKYLKEITATCTKSADLVLKTLEAGKVPLV